MPQGRVYLSLALLLTLLVSLTLPAHASQSEKKKKKEAPTGTPVLWRDPGDISTLDLLAGPGGEEMKPELSSLTFIEEQKGGYSKKYRVRDGKGRVWVAKIGKEAQPETVANRLLWAAGYVTEITHLAPSATIPGKGTFENVRFEARPEGVERAGEWRWERNPFVGTREFHGLKILMALIENWDLKDSNNQVLYMKGELHHVVSDLGATFGKTGSQNSPMALLRQIKGSRNEPGDYVSDKFIEAVEGGHVRFHFSGKNSGLMRGISVSDAKWLGEILARLSDRQIEDAFRAANYTPDVVRLLTSAVRSRINELANLA
ncbi:MAG: hypothetical protein LC803_09980 [Acidobacteria bacterium]|nr:hypothetical protein [Acidobacteriota bacterium]